MADTEHRVGRPRRADVAARVSEATVALVSEHGYAATTLDAIAREAGAAKTTVYRRWESKAALATDVLAEQLGQPPVAAPGGADAGVSTAVRWLVGRIRVPAIRLLLLGLVGEAARDRGVRDRLRTRIRDPFTHQVADAWALPRSRVDLAFDVGVGTLLHRVAMTGEIRAADADAVTEVVVGLLESGGPVSRDG